MLIKNYIRQQCYYDSVLLMRLSQKIGSLAGIGQVSAGMGTPLNLATLEDMNLLNADGRQAGPNDLIFAVVAADEAAAGQARDEFYRLLAAGQNPSSTARRATDLNVLCRDHPELNLAVISVAGEYAGAEARRALQNGLNVFLFSDGVSPAEEAALKILAEEKDLLLMGPGCGLSFINGLAIGLCSKVRRGNIGIVAASGSGMQEVMTLIHRHGGGISQAIGTGGYDLSAEVGGATMLRGLRLLENDPQTDVLVLIAKPPAAIAARTVLEAVRRCHKPAVVQFIQGDARQIRASGATPSESFAETAFRALALASGQPFRPELWQPSPATLQNQSEREVRQMAPTQRYLRGIYCGGTLAEEALAIIQAQVGPVYANFTTDPDRKLDNPFESLENTLIDIGAEEFTRGRPHAAIDPTVRTARFIHEARDPATAVILLDFLLGYALHPDPAGVLEAVIREEKNRAARAGRHLCVLAALCGSDLAAKL